MKIFKKTLLMVFLLPLISSTFVSAETITLEFEGIVSEILHTEFDSLLSVGDSVYGAIQFGFDPTGSPYLSRPFVGGYTVQGYGPVSGFDEYGAGGDATRFRFSYDIDPGSPPGTKELNGIAFFLVSSFTSLDEYFALDTSGFDYGYIRGSYITLAGGSPNLSVAKFSFTEASIRPGAIVPEPTTLFLFISGLIGFAGLGRKKFFKREDYLSPTK